MVKSIPFNQLVPGRNEDDPILKDWLADFELIKYENGIKTFNARPVGPILVMARHWPKSIKSGATCPPIWCPCFDPATQKFDLERPCPMHDDFKETEKAQKVLIFAAIVREWQEGRRKKSNPVGVFILPGSQAKHLVEIVGINKDDISDPDKGCDIRLTYDREEKGPNKWAIHRVDRTPLSDTEREYMVPDLDTAAPDFGDPAFVAEYLPAMKRKLAVLGYYLKDRGNGKPGWDGVVKSADGLPYTEFPEIAATVQKDAGSDEEPRRRRDEDADNRPRGRQSVAASSSSSSSSSKRVARDDDEPMLTRSNPVDDDDVPLAAVVSDEEVEDPPFEVEEPSPPKAAVKPAVKTAAVAKAAPAKAVPAKTEAAPAKSAGGPAKHAEWSKQFGITWIAQEDGSSVPKCFGKYAGADKCKKCPERTGCLGAD